MNFNTDSSLNQSTAATLLAQDSTTQVTALALLDEDGLPNGIPGGPQDAAGQDTVATGTLGYNFGANGPAAMVDDRIVAGLDEAKLDAVFKEAGA